MVSGSCVFSASSPPCGIENGLWLKSILLRSPRCSSNIGKSVIQQKRKAPVSIRPSSSAELACAPRRRTSARRLALPATKNTASPASSPQACADRLGARPAPGCLAIGPFGAVRRRRRCSRGRRRPRSRAQSFSLSKKLRGCVGGARRRDRAHDAARRRRCVANRPKPEPRKSSRHVGDHAAGCAGPACRCRSAASPRRRGCAGTAAASPRGRSANSSNTPCSTGSIVANTSSCVTKHISKSSW